MCPDSIYEGFGPTKHFGLVNTRLVYGHRKDWSGCEVSDAESFVKV